MATSIDGEDELVDVTMKDSDGAAESSESKTGAPKLLESVQQRYTALPHPIDSVF